MSGSAATPPFGIGHRQTCCTNPPLISRCPPPRPAPPDFCFALAQARDRVLMKLAVLNELRLAVGSFAPCEVVMEGSTRVLPLVALRAESCESELTLSGAGADATGSADDAACRPGRPGVSPNRHPQARMGAANVKVRCVCVSFRRFPVVVCSRTRSVMIWMDA